MKKFIFWLFCLCVCPFAIAQNFQVSENSSRKVVVSFYSDNLSVEEISLPQGNFSIISMENYGISNNPGAPMLPLLTKLLQIPVCDSVIVTIVGSRYTDYAAADLGITHLLFPSQPSVSKSSVNPQFVYNHNVYTANEFYALPLVSVEKAGIRRGTALANVYVSPMQYNPVSQTVRIYSQIDVEFSFVNTNIAMTNRIQEYESPLFALNNNQIINPINRTSREITSVPVKYLIVANSMFANNTDLTAFVTWKRRLGYLVDVAYTSDANVGTTTTSIKNFIQSKYDNATANDPAPSFLLLIGDVAQLPAFTGVSNTSHVTDLYYATLAGDDNLPDCYYGRLSATNNTQLSNQIAKIMMYEQYSMPDPSYLGNAVLIAGTDGNGYSPTHADGQINYIYDNYINASSTTHNYTTVYKHNYNCSSQAATIRNEINAGVGLANYTAHGSSSGWADPAFSNTHVSSMTNANKYGLLIGNCCLSGKFDDSECFGEALLRAANKGAMGYIGASNSSYWNEDVYWAVGVRSNIMANMSYSATELGVFDKLFHTHNEAYINWVSTIGGIIQGGNMSVQSSSSSRKLYYWEIYHCFGDPSVRVYLGIPSQMTVNADNTVVVGSNTYTAQVAPYAYVALTSGGNLIAAAYADASGNVTLTFSESLDPGNYELAVLAQNYIPYFQNVEIVDDGACPMPGNLTVTNVSAFAATMNWTGASGLYNIEIKAGSGNWTSLATGVTTTTFTLSNLQENTSYQVRVQADCNVETSLWKSVSFATPVACPWPTNLICNAVTANTASLSWTENGEASSWTLQYGMDSTFATGTYNELTVINANAVLSGLIAESNCFARVRANCGGEYGVSMWSPVCAFVPTAIETVVIGSGSSTNEYLPSYSYYKYELSQQLYTPAEIGSAGVISSIAFYNSGSEKTRTYDMYLVNTNKTSFSSNSDWISVTNADKVFSGTVTMTADEWTVFTLNTPFEYDGVSNLALIMDDNTGSYSNGMQCLVFNSTSNCAIYKYSDNTNYNPSSPSGYSGTRLSVKNQIKISILRAEPQVVPTLTISGNTSVCPGETTTLTASSNVEGTYTWNTGVSGPQITVGEGTYTVTLTFNTDEQISETFTVTANSVYAVTDMKTVCESELPYTWNGMVFVDAGTQTVTLQTMNGCDSVVTMTLSVNHSTTGVDEQTACDSYTWIDGVVYTESTNTPTFTLTNAAGCDSVVTLHLTITVGIGNHDLSNVLAIYPNPTKDVVNVQLTVNNEKMENVDIQVFDVYGRLLDVVETRHGMSLQTTQIDLSHYAKGVYFVKAMSDGKTIAVQKVVKQ